MRPGSVLKAPEPPFTQEQIQSLTQAVCDESGVVPYLRFLGSFQVRPAFAGLGFALFYGEAH